MAIARKRQISLADTKYYHCISRCVRRAYLCGEDRFTGQSYEHRRCWVEEKLLALSNVFCIDVCAYAVMSNHTHLVLYADDKKAKRLNDKAIIIRWHKLCKGTMLTNKYVQGGKLTKAECFFLNETVDEYRERLSSISWFMRLLNEDIARRANKEDGCTGRFWEGRFKSQALLDEAALAACMAYVDLNPIRAKIAHTPETSDYTSVQKRIESATDGKQPIQLLRFAGMPRQHMAKGLPFELKSYLELVELTGRCIREDKRGYIDNTHSRLLERVNISADNWLKLTSHFTRVFHGAVGRPTSQEGYCEHLNRKRRANVRNCEKLLA
ncbi:transposase [Pseudoalteromonas sp. SG43-7]|uniref:transposase n=1 Tax=unclassified Pseudoalteromonas TaxID=194690 RepID=UPI0016022705|nr:MULTISPECIES: transposase [unclassified Pseudoalteromonas]MBB1344093.1 transposase [Pseudoalteromonas sp. SR45-6]MBB1424722.1 transposase [Pseudoalteromonas sp. SG43-7]MBB1433390.1 transposase [Pseudoalteromonas sp. SG43-6]